MECWFLMACIKPQKVRGEKERTANKAVGSDPIGSAFPSNTSTSMSVVILSRRQIYCGYGIRLD